MTPLRQQIDGLCDEAPEDSDLFQSRPEIVFLVISIIS